MNRLIMNLCRSLRVLLVEDSEDSALLILQELQRCGFSVDTVRVESRRAFVEALNHGGWDLIISDFLVPGFGAFEALEEVRQRGCDLPFIVLSSSAPEETVAEVMKAGAHDYVLKGNLTRLGPAIRRELSDAQVRASRREAEAALKRSESRLLLAQRIGKLGSWEVNLQSGALTWTPQTYRIFGVDPATFQPTLAAFYELIHAEDRDRVRQASEKGLKEGGTYSIDHRIVRPDGTQRTVHEEAETIFDSDGRAVQRAGTVQDITERALLEMELRHSQKLDAVGQMAGGIAHDFNNILTVILGYTEIVLTEPGIIPEVRSQVEQIAFSAQRASKLTRQLLAFSRKQPMQIRTVQLNDLLAQMAGMLQRLLGEDIELELLREPALPLIEADSGMIEQVVVNLAVNARDAMPKGGRLTIATRTGDSGADAGLLPSGARPAEVVCLSVIDTGCGMSAEVLSHVFEPFFTTKEVGKGTGLGLSTVYGIVQQHHGSIDVKSQPGAGSKFEIFLPASPRSAAVSAPFRVDPPPALSGHETILLVEDEEALRTMAKNILQKHGYRVLEAGSGPAAIHLWEEFRGKIDLLLTDMVMPGGLSGRELAETLQSKDASLRVLYTSGYSTDFVRSALELREGVNFMPKPYTAAALCHIVHRCLHGSDAAR